MNLCNYRGLAFLGPCLIVLGGCEAFYNVFPGDVHHVTAKYGVITWANTGPGEGAPPTEAMNNSSGRARLTGSEVVIEQQIQFDVDQATIRSASFGILDEVRDLLRSNPSVRLEIQGHTDKQGPAAYNKALSQRRAEAVMAYLIKGGIASSRLTAVGHGMEYPLDMANTLVAYAKNRRVQFVRTDQTSARVQATRAAGSERGVAIDPQKRLAAIQRWKDANVMYAPITTMRSQKTGPFEVIFGGVNFEAGNPNTSANPCLVLTATGELQVQGTEVVGLADLDGDRRPDVVIGRTIQTDWTQALQPFVLVRNLPGGPVEVAPPDPEDAVWGSVDIGTFAGRPALVALAIGRETQGMSFKATGKNEMVTMGWNTAAKGLVVLARKPAK